MSDLKPHRSFFDSILCRWRHLTLARWILLSMSLCLTLTSDNTANHFFSSDNPAFTYGRRRLRSDSSSTLQMEHRSLPHYSKSAKSLSAKAGKGGKGSKMVDHEWIDSSDISRVSSKFGKSKAGKAKSAKSAFGSKSTKGIKGAGKSAKSDSHLRSGYYFGSKSAKGIKGTGKSAKSLEGESAKYIEEFMESTDSFDATFEHDRSPLEGDQSRYSSTQYAADEVISTIHASISHADFVGHSSVGETESAATEVASFNIDVEAVQSGENSEIFATAVEAPPPRDEVNSVHHESNNEISFSNSSLGDKDAESSFLGQSTDLADTVAPIVPTTITATAQIDVNIGDIAKIDHHAEIITDDEEMEAME